MGRWGGVKFQDSLGCTMKAHFQNQQINKEQDPGIYLRLFTEFILLGEHHAQTSRKLPIIKERVHIRSTSSPRSSRRPSTLVMSSTVFNGQHTKMNDRQSSLQEPTVWRREAKT